jgi:hypothetical protein
MINSKTRLRVARVAAGTVFAVGASLTATGAAQAAESDAAATQQGGGLIGGLIGGVIGGGDSGGDSEGGTEGTTGDTSEGGTEGSSGDTTTIGGDTEGTVSGGATGTVTGGDTGGDTGGSSATGGDTGGDSGSTTTTGGDTGGSGGGEEPATVGGSGGGDDTCDLSDDSVDCEGGTQPDSTGSQPVEQAPQGPKEELADTGSAETTFLLVGAATMIAGGVAFRMMPRMINRRTAA